MSTPEGIIQSAIRLEVGRSRVLRLFRNNRGLAWMGKVKKLPGNKVLIENPRPVEFGLTEGASDLIGLRQVVITLDMVGKTVAIFSAAEVKVPDAPVPEHQQRFVDAVNAFGGIAGVVRSPDDARRLFGL